MATGFRRPDPVLYAIVALLGAAILVVYLQYRSLTAVERQATVILQKISEQAAEAAASEIRRIFEGPVFETLTAVNHPLLSAGRFDLVGQHYLDGMAKYPQVERFFMWHALTDEGLPGEVLFFDGNQHQAYGSQGPNHSATTPPVTNGDGGFSDSRNASVPPGFYRDPPFGRLVYELARHHARSQWIYGASEAESGRARYDVFVRLFWIDASREQFFAVLGFVVNLDQARHALFGELYRRRLSALLNPGDGGPPLEMRVLDETGQMVFGRGAAPAVEGRAGFDLRFYPADEIRLRMAAEIPPRRWTVAVSPLSRDGLGTAVPWGTRGYWLSGISVLLILMALSFTLRSRKRAAQLARMQSDFVSYVSHQLKTPLSSLNAVLETLDLERVRSPEKLAQYLKIAQTESGRLTGLVEQILEFSKVQGRSRTYEFETVRLTPLVRETVEAFQHALEHDTAVVTIEEIGPSPLVAADPAALEQVIVNLLDNAVKYSYGPKEVSVRVGRAGSYAVVEVRDRGIGISPQELPHIFDKFYRGSGATLHRHGFGLGLAIAQELVVAHRGRLEVESAVGRGSLFRLRLPLLEKGPAAYGQRERA